MFHLEQKFLGLNNLKTKSKNAHECLLEVLQQGVQPSKRDFNMLSIIDIVLLVKIISKLLHHFAILKLSFFSISDSYHMDILVWKIYWYVCVLPALKFDKISFSECSLLRIPCLKTIQLCKVFNLGVLQKVHFFFHG